MSREESFAGADLDAALVDSNFELAPSGTSVLRVEIIANQVIGGRVVGGALKASRQIVRIVEGFTAGHFSKFIETLIGRREQPHPVVHICFARSCGSGTKGPRSGFAFPPGDDAADGDPVEGALHIGQRYDWASIE